MQSRAEILDAIEFWGRSADIADAVVVGVEQGFPMQPLDYRVALPSQVVAINHAVGLRAAALFLKSSPGRR